MTDRLDPNLKQLWGNTGRRMYRDMSAAFSNPDGTLVTRPREPATMPEDPRIGGYRMGMTVAPSTVVPTRERVADPGTADFMLPPTAPSWEAEHRYAPQGREISRGDAYWMSGGRPLPQRSEADAYRMAGLAAMDQYKPNTFRDTDRAEIMDKHGGTNIHGMVLPSPSPDEPKAWFDTLVGETPADALVNIGLGGTGRLAKAALALGGLSKMTDPAEAKSKMGSLLNIGELGAATRKAMPSASALDFWRMPENPLTPPRAAGEFVNNPQREFAPGIYKDPRIIAAEGAANVAPEHPAMKALFGVTRDDLYEIGQRGTRPGNIEPSFQTKPGAKGSYMSDAVMTPANAQRQIDVLAEAQKYPELIKGMDSWYVSDPMFWQMVKNVGLEQAKRDYQRFNTVVPMFSPASDVEKEINRGTAANMMIERGQFPRFERYGGIAVGERGRGFPKELRDVQPHPYHSTAHTGPVGRYLETGDASDMQSVKVPLYMQASGVPETGFQTKLPIPDAHITRSAGMADVRQGAKPGVSMKTPEYMEWGPWYRENVAKPLGLQAVPAQGRQWGVYAPQTGVDTAIGAPKLEILSKMIWERAAKLGIDPKVLRDQVLHGKGHAIWPLAAGAGLMGSVADEGNYSY